ncbi:DsbE family thiol:disulfide interchange protein [Bacterioplanes sanyensis]|uniref:DsbE family thiol:disulfide interchange protein n=1 Tax=Bacterioplanes sanyensis TaxID=1249553 RepID=A0A222FPC7_9GAMM|nr:DsbE family thiol:disulfide interchange protein [Bacterioplanes sanyensis]ASP40241.1 DsbE family thiol:disulfide interchange protein [Bacterioplanes sanyensis]
MTRWLLFIPLAVTLAMGVLFWIGLGKEDKDALPSPLVGQPFPSFEAKALLSGEAISAASLPAKPMLVNVWATWCPTCKAEHAFLNQLAKQGITIVGINYKDDDAKAREWLKAYGDPYDFNISDPDGKLGLELGVYGAPETFLVDSQGTIRGKHIGDLNTRVWQKLQPQFEAMK